MDAMMRVPIELAQGGGPRAEGAGMGMGMHTECGRIQRKEKIMPNSMAAPGAELEATKGGRAGVKCREST